MSRSIFSPAPVPDGVYGMDGTGQGAERGDGWVSFCGCVLGFCVYGGMLLVTRPPTHTPRGSSAAARIVAVSSTLLPFSTLRTGVSLYSYYSGGYPTLPSSYRQRLTRDTGETRRLLDRVTHMISPPKRPRETDHLSRAAAGGFVPCHVVSCQF